MLEEQLLYNENKNKSPGLNIRNLIICLIIVKRATLKCDVIGILLTTRFTSTTTIDKSFVAIFISIEAGS